MQGNEACAEGPSPPGVVLCRLSITLRLKSRTAFHPHPQVDGTFIQMEDEIASMGASSGRPWRAKSMTPLRAGFSLMQENLGTPASPMPACG